MSGCKFAEGYINKEGFFRATMPVKFEYFKGDKSIVCKDWDAFCTLCLENQSSKERTKT